MVIWNPVLEWNGNLSSHQADGMYKTSGCSTGLSASVPFTADAFLPSSVIADVAIANLPTSQMHHVDVIFVRFEAVLDAKQGHGARIKLLARVNPGSFVPFRTGLIRILDTWHCEEQLRISCVDLFL